MDKLGQKPDKSEKRQTLTEITQPEKPEKLQILTEITQPEKPENSKHLQKLQELRVNYGQLMTEPVSD